MKKSLLPETWPNNIKCKYFMKNTTSKFPSVSEPTDIPLLALLTATNDDSKLTYQYNNKKKKVYTLTAIKLGNCLEEVTSTDCWPTVGQRLANCWPTVGQEVFSGSCSSLLPQTVSMIMTA